jgi:hypothetical protein
MPVNTGRKVGSPGWSRTSDPLINSQVLYQLSYRGTGGNDVRIVPHHSRIPNARPGPVGPRDDSALAGREPSVGMSYATLTERL